MMRQYIKQLLSESAVYGLARVVVKITAVILVPVYTRFFSPDEYGAVGFINNGVFLLTIVSVLGLDAATGIFFWDRTEEDYRKKIFATWFWTQSLVSLFFCACIILFSHQISHALFHDTNYVRCLIFASVSFALSPVSDLFINWLRLQRKAKATFFYSVAMAVLAVLLSIYFVVQAGMGAEGVFAAQILTGLLSLLIAVFYIKDWISLSQFSFLDLKAMLSYSYPLIPASLAQWVLTSSGVYVIGNYMTQADAGIFQVGSTVASGIGIVIVAFQMAWGPFGLSIQREKQAIHVYALAFRLYSMVAVCLALALFLFAGDILAVFTSDQYHTANLVAGILGFGIVIGGYNYIAAMGLNIAKVSTPYGIGIVFSALFTMVLYFFLITPLGKEGVALCMLIGQLLVPVYLFYRAQKIYFIPYPFFSTLFMFLVAALLAILFYVFHNHVSFAAKFFLLLLFILFAYLLNRKGLQQLKG